MRLQNQATGTAMPACHLGTMNHPVATSARRRSPRRPPLLRLGGLETEFEFKQQAAQPTWACRRVGVCGTETKIITGRYRPVPGTDTSAGRSDPVDPVTRWDNLVDFVLLTPHSPSLLRHSRLASRELSTQGEKLPQQGCRIS
jgi:hypothetical protein